MLIVVTVVGLLAGALGAGVGYFAAARHDKTPVLSGGPYGSVPPPLRTTDSLPALIARLVPSVVTVEVDGPEGVAHGSGFVITKNGYLLTNDHVVAEASGGTVAVAFADLTTASAKVVGRDPESDLAVLKVEREGLRPVEFADSDGVAVGDGVLAIGSPLALPGTVTAGIVSAVDRTIETRELGGGQRYYAAIQTDAAVNRGNSGGPLVDLAGRVVGINSVIKSLSDGSDESGGNIGIAFAIPANQAARVATEIIDTGHARRTVIGAQVDRVEIPGGGVRLGRVDSKGPAAQAGLRTGDVVLRLGSHAINEPHDLIALVRRYDPGTSVEVTFRRGSETQKASVTLVADLN